MYGINISDSRSLSPLGKGGKVFEYFPVSYQKNHYWGRDLVVGKDAVYTEFIINSNIPDDAIVALTEGSLLFWVKEGSTHRIATASFDHQNTVDAYFFRPFGSYNKRPEYGISIQNESGIEIFNNNAKTMKLLGYITKKTNRIEWFDGALRASKIALIQVGSDMSWRYPYKIYESIRSSGAVVKGLNISIQTGAHTVLYPDTIIEKAFRGNDERWRENNDILWYIVDVTGL